MLSRLCCCLGSSTTEPDAKATEGQDQGQCQGQSQGHAEGKGETAGEQGITEVTTSESPLATRVRKVPPGTARETPPDKAGRGTRDKPGQTATTKKQTLDPATEGGDEVGAAVGTPSSLRDRISVFESPRGAVGSSRELLRERDADRGNKPRKKKPTSTAFQEFEAKKILINFGGMPPRKRSADEDSDQATFSSRENLLREDSSETPDWGSTPRSRDHSNSNSQANSLSRLTDDEGIHTMDEEDEFAAVPRNAEVLKSFRKPPPPKNRSRPHTRALYSLGALEFPQESDELAAMETEIQSTDSMVTTPSGSECATPDPDTATSGHMTGEDSPVRRVTPDKQPSPVRGVTPDKEAITFTKTTTTTNKTTGLNIKETSSERRETTTTTAKTTRETTKMSHVKPTWKTPSLPGVSAGSLGAERASHHDVHSPTYTSSTRLELDFKKASSRQPESRALKARSVSVDHHGHSGVWSESSPAKDCSSGRVLVQPRTFQPSTFTRERANSSSSLWDSGRRRSTSKSVDMTTTSQAPGARTSRSLSLVDSAIGQAQSADEERDDAAKRRRADGAVSTGGTSPVSDSDKHPLTKKKSFQATWEAAI